MATPMKPGTPPLEVRADTPSTTQPTPMAGALSTAAGEAAAGAGASVGAGNQAGQKRKAPDATSCSCEGAKCLKMYAQNHANPHARHCTARARAPHPTASAWAAHAASAFQAWAHAPGAAVRADPLRVRGLNHAERPRVAPPQALRVLRRGPALRHGLRLPRVRQHRPSAGRPLAPAG